MMIFRHAATLSHYLQSRLAVPFAFVPTMGALHAGHLALVQYGRQMELPVVASIFVNPTQFNDLSDYEAYPQTIGADIAKLAAAGCRVLFVPTVQEMYPQGTAQLPTYPLGSLEHLLEGSHRPGHFQGVCQIVHRLLQLVQPAHLVMGQKDFQQCMVVQALIDTLNLPVQLHTCATLREADGLAMSSRNVRLTPQQRAVAPALYRTLHHVANGLNTVPCRQLEAEAATQLLQAGFTGVDYISIAHPHTLQPVDDTLPLPRHIQVLGAAYLGPVRLIDNIEVS